MRLSDFDYELPEELIAQTPIEKRDESRLLVYHRDSKTIEHKRFFDIVDYINEGDCLVINDTKVLPARLLGIRKDTGGKIEFVLLKQINQNQWETLVKPGRRAKVGTEFSFGNGMLSAEVVDKTDEGNRIVQFRYQGVFEEVLDKIGIMPLPPYIHEKLQDKNRYQTVYAEHRGSAAAPTAGLHFTQSLLEKLQKKGVSIARITLHVGLGTFRPVKKDIIEQHKMHEELYHVTPDAAGLINKAKQNGGRVIAVGTTSTRTLESIADASGYIQPQYGKTDIFIYPGYQFRAIDGLITNFHLPKSTLLMLVSALAGREEILRAYREAVEKRYRFFSFGDAMLIL